jgi:hypothetical protein
MKFRSAVGNSPTVFLKNVGSRSIDSFLRHYILWFAVLGESHSPLLLNYYDGFGVEFSSFFDSFCPHILLTCLLHMWWFHNICYHWVKEWLQIYSKMGCLVNEYGHHALRISCYTLSFFILKNQALWRMVRFKDCMFVTDQI